MQLHRSRALSNLPLPPRHLTDFLAERYALGRITSEYQLEQVEGHLQECSECRKKVERLDAIRAVKKAFTQFA